jgi:PadR family transcriptional regulator PadR
MYGYQIAKQLQGAAPDANVVKQGALYPVLRNMSASGLLASRVVPSYSGPPRRYYRITDEGRTVLRQWLAIWGQTRDFVELFTQPAARATGAD